MQLLKIALLYAIADKKKPPAPPQPQENLDVESMTNKKELGYSHSVLRTTEFLSSGNDIMHSNEKDLADLLQRYSDDTKERQILESTDEMIPVPLSDAAPLPPHTHTFSLTTKLIHNNSTATSYSSASSTHTAHIPAEDSTESLRIRK